jgi:hypothetical protein
MESMAQYVIRRASEEKGYKRVVEDLRWEAGVVEWLRKLAHGKITNPGSARIEPLYRYYKQREAVRLRRR